MAVGVGVVQPGAEVVLLVALATVGVAVIDLVDCGRDCGDDMGDILDCLVGHSRLSLCERKDVPGRTIHDTSRLAINEPLVGQIHTDLQNNSLFAVLVD